MIEVRASIKNGQRLLSYNAWNKQMPIAVKGIGNEMNAFQLPPSIRVIIPTDADVTIDENTPVIKLYSVPEISLKKALILSSGVQLVTETCKVHLIIQNMSESLVTISDGDLLAHALTS